MKISFVALSICCALMGCSPEPTMSGRYPGPWIEDFNIDITKVLMANNVRTCGQYKYRKSSRDEGEYLVYCTTNGMRWSAFTVWVPIGNVMGPNPTDPAIPP